MLDTTTNVFAGVGAEKGHTDSRVSAQWARRPMDERFTSLDEMIAMLNGRTERSVATTTRIADLRPTMIGGRMMIANDVAAADPSHYAFGQLCSAIDAPAGFLRDIADDSDLVMRNLTRCFDRAEDTGREVQLLRTTAPTGPAIDLRGVTGPNYGRIWDLDLVKSIKTITEAGGGRWEVPQAFRTPDMAHHACVDPTKEDTTLYAGDRDVFLFLVDQRNPIEAGFLPDGSPDIYFRGFYAWNGECGGVSNGCATFLYRMVCANRIIWDQKGFQRFSIRHTKNAGDRFVRELIPALQAFVDGSADGVVSGIEAAHRMRIARDDEMRQKFLLGYDFAPKMASRILSRVIDEEGHPAETAFDFVQGITALARDLPWQDERVQLENVAARIMRDVAECV